MTKYCKDCKHKSPRHFGQWCAHPSFGTDLTNGENHVTMAVSIRNRTDLCGPEGKWYEPKPSRLQRFLQFFQPAPKV